MTILKGDPNHDLQALKDTAAMSESRPVSRSLPLDPAELLKMADEITRVVDGGYHKAHGTSPHQSTMTAGNAWWRTVADGLRAAASEKPAQKPCPRCGYPENSDEDLGPSGLNERMPRMT